MTDLTPFSALGAPAVRKMQQGALTLMENDGLALASLALRRGTEPPAPMGLPLPEPGCWSAAGGAEAFWTGPGQWMIAAEGLAVTDFAQVVKEQAPGCSVTEQTDGWVCFEVQSEAGTAPVHKLLEKLVNIDLAGFGPGKATRTVLDHMGVFVIRRADDRLAILGARSAAGSLWHAISVAAARL